MTEFVELKIQMAVVTLAEELKYASKRRTRIDPSAHFPHTFGVSIISDRNQQAFHYHVVAFGKQGHFAKPLHTGTRIKLVVQAQSQPENISTLPLFTATFVRLVRPVARG